MPPREPLDPHVAWKRVYDYGESTEGPNRLIENITSLLIDKAAALRHYSIKHFQWELLHDAVIDTCRFPNLNNNTGYLLQ